MLAIPFLNGYFCDFEGNFYSKKRNSIKKLKLKTNKGGYAQLVTVNKKRRSYYLAHRLIAVVFLNLDYTNKNIQVNHIDMNKLNNSVCNLELVTGKENIHHSIENGKHKATRTSYVIKCLNNGKMYSSIKDAEVDLKLTRGEISRHLNGKRKHVKGYKFIKIAEIKKQFIIKKGGKI